MSDGRFRRKWRTGPSAAELHADDGGAGNGMPVVLLHSLAGNTRQWEAQLARLRSAETDEVRLAPGWKSGLQRHEVRLRGLRASGIGRGGDGIAAAPVHLHRATV